MLAAETQDKILLNRHLKATAQACAVISNVLDFDSAELWVQDGSNQPTCVFIYASDEVSKDHPIVRTTKTFYPTETHMYSPQLCRRLKDARSSIYWRCVDGSAHTLHPESEVPFRTEFVYRVDTQSSADQIYIVGFSRRVVAQHPSTERFLGSVGYAIYVSAFGMERNTAVSAGPTIKAAGGEECRSPDSTILDRKESSLGHSAPPKAFIFDLSKVSPVKALVGDIKLTDISGLKHIADGSHSHILVGELNRRKVVIKILKEESVDNDIALHEYEVEREVLCRLDHPNIIDIVGWGVFPRRFIVLELLGGETLRHMLEKNVSKPGIRIFHKPSFTYLQLLQLGRNMASALGHLHDSAIPGACIIHRDLKPDNIGFTSSGVVKIIDFGLSTCVKTRDALTEAYEMTGNTGSKRYMAPEVALKRPYNEKADVYSFGIILWQMARDKVPFSKMSVDEFLLNVARNGERPKLDKAWPERFSSFLSTCWDGRPSKRPSFEGAVRVLEGLILAEGGTPTPLPQRKNAGPGHMATVKSNHAVSKSSGSILERSPASSLGSCSPPQNLATPAIDLQMPVAPSKKDDKKLSSAVGWF